MSRGELYLFELSFYQNMCLGEELLDHMATLLIDFEDLLQFSKVTAPIYMSTNSVGGFPFFHTLFSVCYL